MVRMLRNITKKAGLPPGSPVFVGEEKTEKVTITVTDYDAGAYQERTVATPEECLPFRDSATVSWINVSGLQNVGVIERLGTIFNIHPLIIEDVLNTHQRPKADLFENHIYFVLRVHRAENSSGQSTVEQISFILGQNFLITFQEETDHIFEAVRNRLRSNLGKSRKLGADYLAYALTDSIVDSYFTLLEKIGEEIENLEDDLMLNPDKETLHAIHNLKRKMLLLRKSIWPLRELISKLQREATEFFSDGTQIFLRDLYDHVIQIIDTSETFRDMISGMLDIYLSSISNRMNEVMKVLTIFAAIFIPLTFIAGVYGMNFDTAKSPWNMPELGWFYGYPFALGLMAATGFGLLFYFKRKKWL